MPRRKASRAPSRPKPFLPDDTIEVVDVEAEKKAEKIKLLLKDFDAQVERRVAEMGKELLNVQDSIRHMYKADLTRYSTAIRNLLGSDYIAQNKKTKSAMRESVANIISSADNILASAVKKRGRGKANTNKTNGPPPSATRSSSRNKQERRVLSNSQTENMLPPPTTSRVPRFKKITLEVPVTPAMQFIGAKHLSSMIVTPKFDTRTPLPPGTIKRRPKLGEIAISLTGSPLQVSPKGWITNLETDTIDEETRAELIKFREHVDKLLNV